MFQPEGNDEYITDPSWLLPKEALKDPKKDFTILGDFEYCDIFGVYHCEQFSARYIPPPVDDFVQSIKPQCFLEAVKPRDVNLPESAVEISSCEQPSEPEYANQKKGTEPPFGSR